MYVREVGLETWSDGCAIASQAMLVLPGYFRGGQNDPAHISDGFFQCELDTSTSFATGFCKGPPRLIEGFFVSLQR